MAPHFRYSIVPRQGSCKRLCAVLFCVVWCRVGWLCASVVLQSSVAEQWTKYSGGGGTVTPETFLRLAQQHHLTDLVALWLRIVPQGIADRDALADALDAHWQKTRARVMRQLSVVTDRDLKMTVVDRISQLDRVSVGCGWLGVCRWWCEVWCVCECVLMVVVG